MDSNIIDIYGTTVLGTLCWTTSATQDSAGAIIELECVLLKY